MAAQRQGRRTAAVGEKRKDPPHLPPTGSAREMPKQSRVLGQGLGMAGALGPDVEIAGEQCPQVAIV